MSGEALLALVVAIEIGEPELADRLAALLADVPGLRLAAPGEPADATLVVPGDPPPGPDVGLSSRELDVLALIAEGGVEQGHCPPACDLGPHGQVPHCFSAR